MIFIHYAEVSFPSKGKAFGLALEIGKPEMVSYFLMIISLYFAWRFYQYSYDHIPLRDLFQRFREALHNRTNFHLAFLAKKEFNIENHEYLQYSNLNRNGFTYYLEFAEEFPSSQYYNTLEETKRILRVPVLKLETYRLYKYCYSVLISKDFSDSIVPYLLFLYAEFLFVTSLPFSQ